MLSYLLVTIKEYGRWSASFGDLFEIDDNVTTLTRGLDRSSGQRVAHPSAIIVLKKGGKKVIRRRFLVTCGRYLIPLL